MALAANLGIDMQVQGYVVSTLAAGTDIFFQGALVNVDANGDVIVAADTSGTFFAGIVQEYIEATATLKVRVIRNAVAWIPHTGAALTDIGNDVFATADDTLADSASNVKRCGIVVDADATNALLLVDFSYGNAA
jgi:hypothetical protein